MKLSFVKDVNNTQLKRVFKNNIKLKEISIDIYPDNPLFPSTAFMLLSRLSEKNAIVSVNDRIVFKKNDTYKSHFMNVPLSEVSECYYKSMDEYFEFILKIQNIFYRITVFN